MTLCFLFSPLMLHHHAYGDVQAPRDLYQLCQNFVLETKQIHIPNHPFAFNPSIIRYGDHYLLSFRMKDPILHTTNTMGLIFLDENFEPISNTYLLKMKSRESFFFSQEQDPRILYVSDKICIVFNNVWKKNVELDKGPLGNEIRRMITAEITFDGNHFLIDHAQWLLNFDTEKDTKTEKNWVPFSYQDTLHLAYSIFPHRIFQYVEGTSSCNPIALSYNPAQWNWGGLRGGSQALIVGDEYLSFFHTCKDMVTVQSDGERMVHYFMGAYTFSQHPPFEVTKMSKEPIIADTFYTSPPYQTWKPLRVVFPGGFIFDEDFIWVVYGKQDHECWVIKLDKSKFLNSLISIKKNTQPKQTS